MAGKKGAGYRNDLTQEQVRELFDLDEKTGVLRWKVRAAYRIKVGDIAGCECKTKGYLIVGIRGRVYMVHRIIFLYVHGYMTEHQVDHISRNKLDNRPCNLREVSSQCNIRNAGMFSDNVSGVRGVCWHKGGSKWEVGVRVSGRNGYLGIFDDFTEAVCHRYAAEQCLSWNDCDANSSAFQYLKQHGILK